MVTWDVIVERENAQLAVDLVSRVCLRKRISKSRRPRKPSGVTRSAEIHLQAKGEQRQPLVGIAVPHCEYRPADYPMRPIQSLEEACPWVGAFMN